MGDPETVVHFLANGHFQLAAAGYHGYYRDAQPLAEGIMLHHPRHYASGKLLWFHPAKVAMAMTGAASRSFTNLLDLTIRTPSLFSGHQRPLAP